MLHGSDGGHIQNSTRVGASAPDTPAALELSAVAIERSESDQSGDLLAIPVALFESRQVS